MTITTRLAPALLGCSAVLWCSAAQADYIEETVLAKLQEWGLEVAFEGPSAVPGGQRWDNVVLSEPGEDASVTVDWVQEIVGQGGTVITFSPRGTFEAEDVTANLVFDDVAWAVQAGEDGEAHKVTGAGIEAAFASSWQEGAVRAYIEGFDLSLDVDLGELLSVTSLGMVEEIGLEGSELNNTGDEVFVAFRNTSWQHETELPQELIDMAREAEASGTEPNPQDVLDAMILTNSSTMAFGEIEMRGKVTDGADQEPVRFDMLVAGLTAAFQGDTGRALSAVGDIRLDQVDASFSASEARGDIAVEPFSILFDFEMARDNLLDFARRSDLGEFEGAEILGQFDVAYKVLSQGISGNIAVDDGDFEGEASFKAGPSREEIQVGKNGLRFLIEATDYDVRGRLPMFSGEELALALGEFRYGLTFPLLPDPGGAVSEAAINFAVRNLSASESLWALADPGAEIPRDPLTLAVDIVAAMDILQPLFEVADAQDAIDVKSLTLKELTLRAGGAEILGEGSAEIDMSGPIPAGDGQFNLEINGLIGLSSAVAKLGLVPPEALLGLRGGLGAFASPTGPDAFSSQIVLSPDGTVTANGIPLPIQ